MNEKIQKFIKEFDENQTKKLAEEKKIKQKSVLIAAGMCEKKYCYDSAKISDEYPFFDKYQKRPYRFDVWELTEDEYNEVVQHFPHDLVENPEQFIPKKGKGDINESAEKIVNIVSNIVGVAGIVLFFLLLIVGLSDCEFDLEDFQISYLIQGLAYMFGGITLYALMQVFRNISLKLNKINE